MFGTICVLDDKENAYSPTFERLVGKYRDFIEAELELMYKNQALADHSREKELLLKETHHRIKNNMNTISGLLEIEADNHKGTPCEEVLQDATGRVRSMMLLYDKLYQTENENQLRISEYLTPLIRDIVALFPARGSVTTDLRLPDLRLNGAVLQPLGIIVCELVTNSMKYAFPDRSQGEVRLSGWKEEGRLVLSYADDGVGLPDSVSFENPETFGLQIVRMLVEQLNGIVSLSGEKRNTYTIRIPLPA